MSRAVAASRTTPSLSARRNRMPSNVHADVIRRSGRLHVDAGGIRQVGAVTATDVSELVEARRAVWIETDDADVRMRGIRLCGTKCWIDADVGVTDDGAPDSRLQASRVL